MNSTTHEPECPKGMLLDFGLGCSCRDLRAAYQRGREDALPLIVKALNSKYPHFQGISLTEAEVDAAIGGEEA